MHLVTQAAKLALAKTEKKKELKRVVKGVRLMLEATATEVANHFGLRTIEVMSLVTTPTIEGAQAYRDSLGADRN
jgi:hypothetical protein